jgi:hypothetical protein
VDVAELKRLRPIIRVFTKSVSLHWRDLDGEEACDRYHELYDMAEKASGDSKFRQYVQPISYWGSVPRGARLSKDQAVTILNSASQLLSYLGSLIGVEEDRMEGNQTDRQPQQVHIHLGNGTTITGNLVVAHSIENSFNKVESADIPSQLKDLLQRLAKEVAKISAALPEDVAEQAGRDLETLTAEAVSKTPRKQWWELSAEGLKQAAIKVGEIGKPVLELVTMIVPLLAQR